VSESGKRACAWTVQCMVLCAMLAGAALGCGDDTPGAAQVADASQVDSALPRDAGPAPADAHVPSAPDAGGVLADGGPARPDAGPAKADSGPADAGSTSGDAGPASAGKPSWLIQSGDSVFFVGNSFFDYDGRVLPEWVAAVGQSVSPKITIKVGSHIVGGVNPLSWFFEQAKSKEAIASKKYHLFLLQGEEMEPVNNKEGFHKAVRDYHAAITASGADVMLFMTWDFAWNKTKPEFFQKLSAAYDEIGAELDIPVIPVGLIYDDTNKAPFAGKQPYFLTGQDLHQTVEGSAANAYATFAMLTGINPMGVEFTAPGQTNSPELLKYLSDKAWLRVSSRLHE